MCRRIVFRRTGSVLLAVLLAVTIAGCGHSASEPGLYHCPMHPTYVSDRPGDCPICGMRLVPVETKTAPEPQRTYVCPMHPEVTAPDAGRCPKCGMPLVLREEEGRAASVTAAPAPPEKDGGSTDAAPQGLAPVQLDAEAAARAGVRTAKVQRRPVPYQVRTVGTVVPDETRIRHIHTKISGWVEKLYVNFTGRFVARGEPVLTLYSPELLASQQEFLKARELAERFSRSSLPEVREGGKDLLDAARRRLELFDVPERFLETLESTGVPERTVPLLAPVSGFVTAKGTYEGQRVEPETELFTVTDLTHVWIEADFYEYEAPMVRTGQEADVLFPYDPGRSLKGQVAYVYPTLNPESRTLRVRIDVPNPDLSLKPSMYVDVSLNVVLPESLRVPDSAVLDSGLRQVVFVAAGGGRFEPREVKVGVRTGGMAQILSGLSEGEDVAVRANFLLDSESRLRAAIGAASEPPPDRASGGGRP